MMPLALSRRSSCFSNPGRAFFAAGFCDRRCYFIPIIRRKIMKKLRLELDALEVDSFQTSWLDTWDGTVNGAQDKVSAGGATQCGGVETCGDGCRVTGGGATQCGGVQTCGGCKE
jgi:heterocycloanthracin/sonorensin family bacteriocin